jgi:hypothetical protein
MLISDRKLNQHLAVMSGKRETGSMTDVRFENNWHVFHRALNNACDRYLPKLLFRQLTEFKVAINSSNNKEIASVAASFETRSLEVKGPGIPFSYRFDFEDTENGGSFLNSCSKESLLAVAAASDVVERLLETVEARDEHILDPTGKLLCERLERGRGRVEPTPSSVNAELLKRPRCCPDCLDGLGRVQVLAAI